MMNHKTLNCRAVLFAITGFFSTLATSVASVHESGYYFGIPSLPLPNWVQDQVVYEINVRQFSPSGDFEGVRAQLPRLKELKVTTLWFMPIHPIGTINRKGPLGSYYSVQDYYGINPEFGTKEDFKRLTDEAKTMGFHLMIDWVGNHTAWDNPLTTEHPDFYATDEEGHFVPPFGFDWTDVIQLDYNNHALWEYQRNAVAYWIQNFGIDGIRFDYAKGIPTPFWNYLADELQKVKPDVFLLAESEESDQQVAGFHASYGWELLNAFNQIAAGQANATRIDTVLAEIKVAFPEGSTFLQMITNHDQNSWFGTAIERLGPSMDTFAMLTVTLPGIPLIYSGQEVGLDHALKFFERDPIVWKDYPYTSFFQTLFCLKERNKALETLAPMERIPSTQNDAIFAFARYATDGQKIIVIANLSNEEQDFAVASNILKGDYRCIFEDKDVSFGKVEAMHLGPWQFRLLESATQDSQN